MAIHGVQPTSNLGTESRGQSMLHERAAGHRCGAVSLGQLSQATAKGSLINFKDVESLSNLENQAGIVRVLTGCAPVNESRCLRIVFRDQRCELLDQRYRGIKRKGGCSGECVGVDQVCLALRNDRWGCGRGDYATASLSSRERGLEVQHALETRGVRENFAHCR